MEGHEPISLQFSFCVKICLYFSVYSLVDTLCHGIYKTKNPLYKLKEYRPTDSFLSTPDVNGTVFDVIPSIATACVRSCRKS